MENGLLNAFDLDVLLWQDFRQTEHVEGSKTNLFTVPGKLVDYKKTSELINNGEAEMVITTWPPTMQYLYQARV